jgi:hypothetical protein
VGKETFIFQIKFCDKSPALRVAANRWQQAEKKERELRVKKGLTTKCRVYESEKTTEKKRVANSL